MCFWKRKPKRVKFKYKFESIHLEEQVDSNRWWIVSSPVSSAYEYILNNLNLVNTKIVEKDRKLSVSIIKMKDDENMIIELEGYKQDIKDFINLLIEKDINFIKWYKITLD